MDGIEKKITEQKESDLKGGMPYFVVLNLKWNDVLNVERREGLITKDTQKFGEVRERLIVLI